MTDERVSTNGWNKRDITVLVIWAIYYSLPFSRWRHKFGDWVQKWP